MRKFAPSLLSSRHVTSVSNLLAHWFPMPRILHPRSVGVDISDASIKWIALEAFGEKKRVIFWGEELLPEGIVIGGIVQNFPELVTALEGIRKKLGGIVSVHVALPEEIGYVFSMHVPVNSSRESALHMIEFELEARVPIPVADAVYDFDLITQHDDDSGDEIGVTVFPRKPVERYVEAFQAAGFYPLSLEIEARSIARAVSSGSDNEPIMLLVDFGQRRTGFAVLKHGIPIFTSTVGVGGVPIMKSLTEKTPEALSDASELKAKESVHTAVGDKESPAADVLLGSESALADEVVRHYQYWDTRRNERGERVTPIECVLLVGGSANLKGLPSYIAARVQASAVRPNVWRHVCSFDTYIPPIDRRKSLQYATAIGLALRGV